MRISDVNNDDESDACFDIIIINFMTTYLSHIN